MHSPNERLLAEYVPLGVAAARELFVGFAGLRWRDRVIDLHSHILPGVDDGATRRSRRASRSLGSALPTGSRRIAATPHVRDDLSDEAGHDGAAPRGASGGAAGRRSLAGSPGGEIALAWLDRPEPDDLSAFGLGGIARYLLVEFPLRLAAPGCPSSFRSASAGSTPVIAHPERNADVQAAPGRATAARRRRRARADHGRVAGRAHRPLVEGCSHG